MDEPANTPKMSNSEFAERLGIGMTTASRLRNGERRPGGDLLSKIIEEFKLPANEALAAYRDGAREFGRYLDINVFGRPVAQAEHDLARIRSGQAKTASQRCPQSYKVIEGVVGPTKVTCPECGRPNTSVHRSGQMHGHQRPPVKTGPQEQVAS